ncbi:NADP-dependent oxidoreductase [Micromonospora inositola]|uniref:NADPH:quinone reductase n=1 Tax=Micromonospora inositola TaxID=47865 RepID=A0A1C5JJ42_9ACTN|nr:NADP-dependent oxidoreductase [Micromonospora inositola]SCG70341.1 NADPH:quinone reductase [Micromonospora inositola]
MRAITLHDLGAPPALADDQPQPGPRPGEVLVRVRASSVNGIDRKAAAGMLKGRMEYRFPVVLGKDFAGTVEAVGDGPTRFGLGDPVFGVVMRPYLGDGAWADFLAVGDQHGIAWVPDGLDLPTAGALGLAGTTAVDALNAVAPRPGDTVLIAGATGGVGALAIQYAAAAGARVIATARPGSATDFVRQLGATEVVDYTGDLSGQVRAVAPDGVRAVVHLAGDGAQLAALLTPDGRLASTIGFGPDQHPAATSIMASPEPATLDRIADDAAAGRLRVPITGRYDLADVPRALTDFSGALGKLGITVS